MSITPCSPAPWSYQYSPYTVRDPGTDATSTFGDELPAFEVFDADGNKVFDSNEDTPHDCWRHSSPVPTFLPTSTIRTERKGKSGTKPWPQSP